MKTYGREKIVQQNPEWKRDYHLYEKGRKIADWWGNYLHTFISFSNQA